MKKLLALLLLLIPSIAYSDTATSLDPHLILITTGTLDRTRAPGDKLNENFSIISATMNYLLNNIGVSGGGAQSSFAGNIATSPLEMSNYAINNTSNVKINNGGLFIQSGSSTALVVSSGTNNSSNLISIGQSSTTFIGSVYMKNGGLYVDKNNTGQTTLSHSAAEIASFVENAAGNRFLNIRNLNVLGASCINLGNDSSDLVNTEICSDGQSVFNNPGRLSIDFKANINQGLNVFRDKSNNTNPVFSINSNRYLVGVGTNAPSAYLYVNATSSILDTPLLAGATGSYANARIFEFNVSSTDLRNTVFMSSASMRGTFNTGSQVNITNANLNIGNGHINMGGTFGNIVANTGQTSFVGIKFGQGTDFTGFQGFQSTITFIAYDPALPNESGEVGRLSNKYWTFFSTIQTSALVNISTRSAPNSFTIPLLWISSNVIKGEKILPTFEFDSGSFTARVPITATQFIGDGSLLTGVGGGGSSSLGVFKDEVQITSPTAQINFKGSGVTVVQAGSTATVTINGGGSMSVPLPEGSTNYAGYRSTFTFQQPQTFFTSATFRAEVVVSSLSASGTITSTTAILGQVFQSSISVGIPIANPTAGTYLIKKALFGMNLTRIACIVDPADSGENTVLNLQECDADGDTCTNITAADVTCGNTNTEAGAISNNFIDAGDWFGVKIVSVSGTVSQAVVTLGYQEVRP